MKNLESSWQTMWFKWGFPIVFLSIFLSVFLFSKRSDIGLIDYLFPLFFFAVFACIYWFFIWDLADEVLDAGEHILVTRRGLQERIALTDILNVEISRFSNPVRLSLRLRKKGKLDDQVAFIPKWPFTLNPFARNPIAEDLIKRVDQAKAGKK
jgi:hypothetical protein